MATSAPRCAGPEAPASPERRSTRQSGRPSGSRARSAARARRSIAAAGRPPSRPRQQPWRRPRRTWRARSTSASSSSRSSVFSSDVRPKVEASDCATAPRLGSRRTSAGGARARRHLGRHDEGVQTLFLPPVRAGQVVVTARSCACLPGRPPRMPPCHAERLAVELAQRRQPLAVACTASMRKSLTRWKRRKLGMGAASRRDDVHHAFLELFWIEYQRRVSEPVHPAVLVQLPPLLAALRRRRRCRQTRPC